VSAPRHCLSCGARLRAGRQDGFRRWPCRAAGGPFYDTRRPLRWRSVGAAGHSTVPAARRALRGLLDLAGGFPRGGRDSGARLRREAARELGARIARRGFAASCGSLRPRRLPVRGSSMRCAWPGASPGTDVSEVRGVSATLSRGGDSALRLDPPSAGATTCGAATRDYVAVTRSCRSTSTRLAREMAEGGHRGGATRRRPPHHHGAPPAAEAPREPHRDRAQPDRGLEARAQLAGMRIGHGRRAAPRARAAPDRGASPAPSSATPRADEHHLAA